MRVTRGPFAVGLLWMVLPFPSQSPAASGDNVLRGLDPLTVPVSVLHTHIVRETTKAARILSPEGRRVVHQSLNRFLNWAEGYCQGDAGCLRTQYYNYLAAIPNSVYRVGRWTVYNTGVYALEWADEDLQGLDPDRVFTWDLQLTWPRVDTAANPVHGHIGLANFAYRALGERVHQLMADWVKGGWNRLLDVHLEGIDDCYVSARITASTYTGGAHPNEDFSTFNWNVRTKHALENTDLFRADSDWRSAILALYRQRLQASGTNLSERALSSDGMDTLLTNGFVITAIGLRFVQHQGATRNEKVPAVDLSWNDLAPWLVPEASCAMSPGNEPR
jgi:hypothetical protein